MLTPPGEIAALVLAALLGLFVGWAVWGRGPDSGRPRRGPKHAARRRSALPNPYTDLSGGEVRVLPNNGKDGKRREPAHANSRRTEKPTDVAPAEDSEPPPATGPPAEDVRGGERAEIAADAESAEGKEPAAVAPADDSSVTAPADVGPADVRPADVGPADVGPADVGPADVGPADVGPDEVTGVAPVQNDRIVGEPAATDVGAVAPAGGVAGPADDRADGEVIGVEGDEVAGLASDAAVGNREDIRLATAAGAHSGSVVGVALVDGSTDADLPDAEPAANTAAAHGAAENRAAENRAAENRAAAHGAAENRAAGNGAGARNLPVPHGDDLRQVVGIGPVIHRVLLSVGITTYRQLAWLADDGDTLTRAKAALGADVRSRIERQRWVEQARELHFRKYGERL
jgi:predicted flap endonuclease-1-like 5' DNA nuclease